MFAREALVFPWLAAIPAGRLSQSCMTFRLHQFCASLQYSYSKATPSGSFSFRGVPICEHLKVLGVADLFAGVEFEFFPRSRIPCRRDRRCWRYRRRDQQPVLRSRCDRDRNRCQRCRSRAHAARAARRTFARNTSAILRSRSASLASSFNQFARLKHHKLFVGSIISHAPSSHTSKRDRVPIDVK